MKKRKYLALLLLPALLLGGCQRAPGQDDAPFHDGGGTAGVQPLALPSSDGIRWDDAPSDTLGSGDDAPRNPAFPHYAYNVSGYVQDSYGGYGTEPNAQGVILTVNTCALTGLRDTDLQEKINAQISERVEALSAAPVDVDLVQAAAAQGFDARVGSGAGGAATENYGDVTACARRFVSAYASITGRLLCIHLSREDSLELYDGGGDLIYIEDWVILGHEQEALLFDLADGRLLSLGDLFYAGSDYHAVIDRQIAKMLGEDELKRPFRGLPDDYPYIWVDHGIQVSLPENNPYTVGSRYFYIPLEELYAVSGMLLEDPSPYLADSAVVTLSAVDLLVELTSAPLSSPLLAGGETTLSPRLRGGVEPAVADAVNSSLAQYETRFSSADYLPESLSSSLDSWDWTNLSADVDIVGSVLMVSYNSEFSGPDSWTYQTDCLLFDLYTGRRLTAADLLVPSEALDELLQQNGLSEPLEEMDNIRLSSDFSVYILPDSLDEEAIIIPAGHFNLALLEKEETP